MLQSMWSPMERHTFNGRVVLPLLMPLLTLIFGVRFGMGFATTIPTIHDTSALFTAYGGLNSGEVHANGNIARAMDVEANDFYQFNDIDPSHLFADTFKPSNFVSFEWPVTCVRLLLLGELFFVWSFSVWC